MSRWRDAFDSHPFQVTWTALKDALDKSTVDDETIVTSVAELARLKKVVEYLNGLIEEVDPEIVPMTTWDACNQQAAPCLQGIVNYNANRNIVHIQQANAHIDNLLTYIKPYMVLPKAAAASIKRAATAHAKVAEEYVESFQKEASSALEEIKASKEEANEYFNETLVGNANVPSTKKEILLAKEAILAEQEEIESLTSSVKTEVSDLEKFHAKIFGKLDGDEEQRVGGMSEELDTLKGKLSDFEVKQQKKYKALVKEIEGILPGATSASLAQAYKDMKESFNDPIKNMSWLFYGSLGFLVFVSLMLAIESIGGEHWITFVSFKEWDTVLKGLVYKLPFYAPVIWLAYYASKRRSEYQRLQQEYAHKESLAKSYISYKEQIEALGDEDGSLLRELIMKSIGTIAHNASESLDGKHGDKAPTIEALESSLDILKKLQAK